MTEADTSGRSAFQRVVRWLGAHSLHIVIVSTLLAPIAALVLVAASDTTVSFKDEDDYLRIANNVAESNAFSLDGVSATAYRPPGFPAALSFVARIDGDLTVLRMANAALLVLLVPAAAWLAFLLGGRVAAALSAPVVALSPLVVFTATKLYPQTFASLLLVTSLAALVMTERTEHGRRLAWASAAGLLLSCLTLTVPNHGVTLVVGVAWLLWRGRKAAILPSAVVLVLFALPIAGWTARNYSVFDEVVPLSTNGGVNLLLGNSEGAGAGTGTTVDLSEYRDRIEREEMTEVEADRYLRSTATTWISDHPVDAVRLYFAKLANTFAVQQEMATESQQQSKLETLILAVSYLPLLALFLARPVFVRRFPLRTGEGLLIATFWVNVLAAAVFFTRMRFRVPLDVIMIVSIATWASAWASRPADREVETELSASEASV